MPRQIILAPEAKADIREAYDWYENQAPGLGEAFLQCLEDAFGQISRSPTRYPARFDAIRRILIRRFPYAVYFDYDAGAVHIYYVFHCAQNPVKVRKRLGGS